MKRNMDWKSWLALIVSMSILCGLSSHFFGLAHAEDEGYWLDDVDGVVILDDPEYFPDEEVGTPGDLPVESPEAPEQTPETSEQPDATEQPAETPDQPDATEQPVETPDDTPIDLKELFHVEVKVPSGWRNTPSATVRIKVTPKGDSLWHSLRYRLDDGDWNALRSKDFTLYEGYYYADIEVVSNAKITVRLYGDEANWFDTSKEIRLFDCTAPTVTAGFKDLLLHVEAMDDLSEVAGIQVNGLLFTTLVDGMLDVRMEEPLLGYRQLAIRAYDYAGNFSEPVTLDNPYYTAPTPEPTVTPNTTKKPTSTKKPSGSSSTKKPTATPTATAVPQQVVTVTQVPSATTTATTTATETVYVSLGPGQPYTPSGNMQTLDMLYSANTNKQFITVQTRAGETYYLVIDYDKPIDEENEIYETYFLNLVDDRDLMSVVSADEIVATPTPQIVYVTPEPVQSPVQTTPVVVEDESSAALPVLVLLLGAAAVGGVGFWWVKRQKADEKARDAFAEEFELEEEEE